MVYLCFLNKKHIVWWFHNQTYIWGWWILLLIALGILLQLLHQGFWSGWLFMKSWIAKSGDDLSPWRARRRLGPYSDRIIDFMNIIYNIYIYIFICVCSSDTVVLHAWFYMDLLKLHIFLHGLSWFIYGTLCRSRDVWTRSGLKFPWFPCQQLLASDVVKELPRLAAKKTSWAPSSR